VCNQRQTPHIHLHFPRGLRAEPGLHFRWATAGKWFAIYSSILILYWQIIIGNWTFQRWSVEFELLYFHQRRPVSQNGVKLGWKSSQFSRKQTELLWIKLFYTFSKYEQLAGACSCTTALVFFEWTVVEAWIKANFHAVLLLCLVRFLMGHWFESDLMNTLTCLAHFHLS